MRGSTEYADLWRVEPFSADYGGLVYSGEVVYADTWDAGLGQALEGDVHFRIVMLRRRRPVPAADIQDSRIAVCVPGRAPSRDRSELNKELSAIRETQGLYLTRRTLETGVVRDYLERHHEKLQERLAGEEAALYAAGHIQSPAPAASEIKDIFAGAEPSVWYEKLARVLLSWAYPSLPVDASLLPRPLSSEDIRSVYEAIFAARSDDRGALGEFGPGLDLSGAPDPQTFSPSESTVFRQIRDELSRCQGELAWKEIQDLLVLAVGLTRPLATLYLLAFVYFGEPEAELRLAPEHRQMFRDGRHVRGSRLTRESIPYLQWPEDGVGEGIETLTYLRQEISWNDALLYSAVLCQGLTEIEDDPAQVSRQESELLSALHELDTDVKYALELLEALSTALGADEGGSRSALQGLLRVCRATEFRQVHDLARDVYYGPQKLLEALELLRRVLIIGDSLGEIVETRDYIDVATVESGYSELGVDRTALLEVISSPVSLAGAPGWPVVKERARDFQRRYRRAYIGFHGRYHRQVAQLRASLEASRPKLHAVELLDRLDELGAPMGLALLERYGILERGLWLCAVTLSDLDLESTPRCADCLVVLGKVPPATELEGYVKDLDMALAEQNRRLSRLLVRRILDDQVDERLDSFLKIVQASDLSALCNTLNDDMLQLIRRILGDR